MKDTRINITFEYEGKNYELYYTASTLKQLERSGFDFSHIESKTFTAPEELFIGAFQAKHKNTPRKTRLEIYEALCGETDDGDALTEILFNMVSEAMEEINTHKGNVKWSVNNK